LCGWSAATNQTVYFYLIYSKGNGTNEFMSNNGYYADERGLDVTTQGATVRIGDDSAPMSRFNPPAVWYSGNIWCVAALLTYGVKVLTYELCQRTGRWSWALDNTDDRAFQLAQEFKTPGAMLVPVLDMQHCYKTACRVRDAALGRNGHYGHGRSDQ
jgi:hypothetical protein